MARNAATVLTNNLTTTIAEADAVEEAYAAQTLFTHHNYALLGLHFPKVQIGQ
ncbi:hypothetical protein [Tritonibacter mobilis]|uniref:hypothetical protein n=1 Tax=Tritonibacter mobilis TaxID=379347 RepID=UPI003A5C75DA